MSLSYEELESRVIEWAAQRKIIPNSNPTAQLMKTMSELGELADATLKEDWKGIEDGVGDVLVTLILYCRLQDISLTESLNYAYDQIKDRTGELTEEGVFVKDSDENNQQAETPQYMVVEGRFDSGFTFYGPFTDQTEMENFGWGFCGNKGEWWFEELTPPQTAIDARKEKEKPDQQKKGDGNDDAAEKTDRIVWSPGCKWASFRRYDR